ncbi:MAG: hypothetical protein E7372_02515 [Clostridiales bacterium]|nr:hypothetical protein [Clostridiales bacterium]
MRKFFVTITTILLVGVLCLSSLFGCKLITTNTERDMKQVVATVKIDDAPMKTIYKQDLVVAYNNYINNTGDYSTAPNELFKEVIDSLIQNAVLVQYSMKHFADKLDISGDEKWEIETYLDDKDILDCEYNAYLKFEELVDGYIKDKPEDKVGDTYTGSVRVVPTGATVETEIEDSRKQRYIDTFWQEIIVPNYNAYVKTINALKANDLLGDYEYGEIDTIEYFNQVLTSYQEGVLVGKLQEDIEKEARSVVDYNKVKELYEIKYNSQEDNASLDSAISSIGANSPILYGQDGYGMVYHILLKADKAMTDEIAELKEKYKKDNGSPAYELSAYRTDRANIFKDITAQDQRTSWIESKYDFGGETTAIKGYTKAFTGDYTLNSEEALPFFGDVVHLNEQDVNEDDYRARYRVDDVKKFSLSEILSIINEYLYNGSADVSNVTDRAVYTATTVNPNYDKRVKELMFAFSQDDSDSALNTYKGYAIKPTLDGTEKEEWMPEFATVGRELIKKDQKTFMLVATDYGYHIMFFSEYFGNGYAYATLEEYLNKEFKFSNSDITSWEQEFDYMVNNYKDYENTNNYLYVLYNELASTYVEHAYEIATETIYDQYAEDSNVVVRYKDAYKDLIEE